MTNFFAQGGYEKIAKVETQTIREDVHVRYDGEYGSTFFPDAVVGEYVWITTKAGDVFMRDLRKGEVLEDVAAYYRKRGYTDDDCILTNFS